MAPTHARRRSQRHADERVTLLHARVYVTLRTTSFLDLPAARRGTADAAGKRMFVHSFAQAFGPDDEVITLDEHDIIDDDDDDGPLSVFDPEKARDDAC